jgi:hypothetical protein
LNEVVCVVYEDEDGESPALGGFEKGGLVGGDLAGVWVDECVGDDPEEAVFRACEVAPRRVEHDVALCGGGLGGVVDDRNLEFGRCGVGFGFWVGWEGFFGGDGQKDEVGVLCGVDEVQCVVGAGEKDGLGGCAVGEGKRETLECRGERVAGECGGGVGRADGGGEEEEEEGG